MPHFFKNLHYGYRDFKRYNLIPIKDNCALFSPTLLPYFQGQAI